ncbi:MAG: signal recognition particle protein [Gammaproteobacteria bacterium]|nr:signal recognition particle protein [Gammaproteobacteria bacterium]MCP4091137.1 signal recognition particle protein [Gammaproteobacteria bacterium]MCP4277337.1 signal recognition particle protein [Gammaproteobacteria bacterium]MCP4831602.1 signal recognition particle protein [Gammaproteobacteria bacterium]MCP4927825.1 signal recognition particle protein [Gammaproteobacteria bacterium]
MFGGLSARLRQVSDKVRGRGRLTEGNIKEAVRDVRMALLEADVALPVVKGFVARVKQRAIGSEVLRSLSPGQVFIKILNQELTRALGGESAELQLRQQPPVIILLAGLQGAGKTTTAAKLAAYLKGKPGKHPMLVSLDTRRPAAMLQLQQLAERVDVPFVPFNEGDAPLEIAIRAIAEARKKLVDVVILDTAGRTRLEDDLLQELKQLHAEVSPAETLFVVDSMAGQDAVHAAQAFGDALPLTGVILTKTDGDARGGAALSVKTVTGKPIKFIGTGEDISGFEMFHPERMAQRILGMGDVLSLVEEVEQKVDSEQAARLVGKMRKGKGFDLADMRDQLSQMLNMGDMKGLFEKLPLPGNMNPDALAKGIDTKMLKRQVAIINSMTLSERQFPKTINGSRKKRIASGAGLQVQDVNRLLKQHVHMQKTMKKMGKGGMQQMMQSLGQGGGGQFPPR